MYEEAELSEPPVFEEKPELAYVELDDVYPDDKLLLDV